MDFIQIKDKLKIIQQEKLLKFLDPSSSSLLQQVADISIKDFFDQKKLLITPPKKSLDKVEAVNNFCKSGNIKDIAVGEELVTKGKVGCLLIAGGQATRLRFNGPKGMFPVSVINGKTLFQIFSEKVLAVSKRAKRPLPFAIMTSPLNHDTTVEYFEKNNYFGLDPLQVSFFQQETLPFLSDNGNLFLESKTALAVGPNGNGKALHQLVKSGVWSLWKEQGVEYVNQILIDNPLAQPYDFELVGCQNRLSSDVAIKCTDRKDQNEKVGVLVNIGGHVEVIEYSELPDNDQMQFEACANISLYCYTMDFIKRISAKAMPLHLAHKSVHNMGKECMAWKFEYFIFDVLQFTDRVCLLKCPRDLCFSPLKNTQGNDSIATVQKALQKLDKMIYKRVFGQYPPEQPFELAQELHFLSEDNGNVGEIDQKSEYVFFNK